MTTNMMTGFCGRFLLDDNHDCRYHWCTYPHDVDCGDRDCPPTSVHCPEPTTRPTTTEDCSSSPPIDCDETGEQGG